MHAHHWRERPAFTVHHVQPGKTAAAPGRRHCGTCRKNQKSREGVAVNMLLQKDREFMLPARPAFIALSLFAALLFNGLPWHGIWLALRPDMVALVLLYWCTH